MKPSTGLSTIKPVWKSIQSVLWAGLLLTGLLGISSWLMAAQGSGSLANLLVLDSVHIWWYVSRAAGIMSYLLFWLSMVWGFAVRSKILDGVLERTFIYDFHEHISLLSLGFMGVHAIVLLLDMVEPLSLSEVLIPFVSVYRPLWVGLGIIGFYLSVLVSVTFYLRSRISLVAFRKIHYLSIAAYIGGLLHSIYAGTDSSLPGIQIMYWATSAITIFLCAYWLISILFRKISSATE